MASPDMTPADNERAEKSWRAALEERRKMRECAERAGFQGVSSPGNPLRYGSEGLQQAAVVHSGEKPSEKWHPGDLRNKIFEAIRMTSAFRETTEAGSLKRPIRSPRWGSFVRTWCLIASRHELESLE